MRSMLHIQCAVRGLLTVNGQFCGPVDGEGQTFPTARDAEIFIEYMPLTENAKPMALELALEQGKVSRIEPAPHGYALIWPDGLIQLELRPEAPDMPEAGETEQAAPNVLLLDEPTSFLDVHHKIRFLEILRRLATERGIAVVLSMHELEFVRKISDEMACIKEGRILKAGAPEEILTEALIEELFDLPAELYRAYFTSGAL